MIRQTSPLLVLAFLGFLAVTAFSTRAAGQIEVRTILDGVYTRAQADRGQTSYLNHCTRCHGDDLQGNPVALGLTGTRFVDEWREGTLFSLFDHIATRMPLEPRTTLPVPV